jgi:hypothetical protein
MIQSILIAIGGLFTAVSAVMGSYALIQARRTERRSATKEETAQAFELQQKSMENVEKDNVRLRERSDQLHDQFADLALKIHDVEYKHRKCERSLEEQSARHQTEMDNLFTRLRHAEAKISELGG